jgi:hypothetical protein
MKLTTATEKEKSPSPTSSVCPSNGKFILKLHVEKIHGQRIKNYNELIRHQGANWDIHAFIWNFYIFSLISQSDIANINKLILILNIIGPRTHYDVTCTNKNNNVRFEGLHIHYH